jgi:hypothetical protein
MNFYTLNFNQNTSWFKFEYQYFCIDTGIYVYVKLFCFITVLLCRSSGHFLYQCMLIPRKNNEWNEIKSSKFIITIHKNFVFPQIFINLSYDIQDDEINYLSH